MIRPSAAIVGASADRRKFGNKAVRAYLQQGWTVHPVNPRGGTVEGVEAFTRLADIPGRPHRVLLYLPPEIGITVLPEIVTAAPAELYVNPGADGPELLAEARRLGLSPILACGILAIGVSPSRFPD